MSSNKKLLDILDRLRSAEEDQFESIDQDLTSIINESDPDSVHQLIEDISTAISNNQFLATKSKGAESKDNNLESILEQFGSIDNGTWYYNLKADRNFVHGDMVKFIPRNYALPNSLDDLIRLVRSVPPNSAIDMIGAGLSTNGLYAQNCEYMLSCNNLNKKLPLDATLYDKDPKTSFYYQTEVGIRVPKLLNDIHKEDMALSWGGYTPQSLIGIATTSTHKSGFLPPITDYILSVDIVQSDGVLRRIEPNNGITNPAAYAKKYPNNVRELIKDDKTFYSSIVLCSVGVVYSVILQTGPLYSLILKRKFYDEIDDAKPEIARLLKDQCSTNPAIWQLDLWVMPKSRKTMVVTHQKIPYDSSIESTQRHGLYNIVMDWLGKRLWETAYNVPGAMEGLLELLLNSQQNLEGEKLDWRHFLGGNIPPLKMLSSETMIPYEGDENNFDGKFIELIKRIGSETHSKFYNSPMGVRFVGASKHAMSMFKKDGKGRFISFEQPFVPHGRDGHDILRVIKQTLLGGRSHWGQNNLLDGNINSLKLEYGADLENYFETRNKLMDGKPNIFRLPRYLQNSAPSYVDVSRYYRIREGTQGGYFTFKTAESWLTREARTHDEFDQFFYFTAIDDGCYNIQTIDHKYLTMTQNGGMFGVKQTRDPDPKRSRFRIVVSSIPNRSFNILEFTHGNELLSIGSVGTWDGYIIRYKREYEIRQSFWFEDTGPIVDRYSQIEKSALDFPRLNKALLKFDLDYEVLTVEAWVKSHGGAPIRGIFSSAEANFIHLQTGNSGECVVYTDGGPMTFPIVPLSNGSWQHVVLSIKPGNSQLYVNGRPYGQANTLAYNLLIRPKEVLIGNGYNNSRPFNGKISKVRFWEHKSLTDQEVSSLYNLNVTPHENNISYASPTSSYKTISSEADCIKIDKSVSTGLTSLTIEAWINCTNGTLGLQSIVSATDANFVHFQIADDKDVNIAVYINDGDMMPLPIITDIPFGWHHVALSIASGYSFVYLDGKRVEDGSDTVFDSITSSENIFVGKGYNNKRLFNGNIADVRIWKNRALSEEEIRSNMHSPPKSNADGLVFHLR